MLFWSISLGEAVEDSGQANSEQIPGLKRGLVAEQMEFHQQFISNPAMEWGDDVGEGLMKGALAVCNGLSSSQRECLLWNGRDPSAEDIAVKIVPLAESR